MKCCSKQPALRGRSARGGFTLIEVAAAILILSSILATTLVVMNNCVGGAIDLRNQSRAFELARENLEFLLTANQCKENLEYGFDEINPEVQWQLSVEPFYEPISNRMWIRAVSSAEYVDSKGERQTVELQHWLTGLTARQIQMIQAQQKLEEDFLDSLYTEEEKERQALTKAYLQERGLDVEIYEQLLARQRNQIIAYLDEHGIDAGYLTYLDQLRQEADWLLVDLGVDWEDYQNYLRTGGEYSDPFGESYNPWEDLGEDLGEDFGGETAGESPLETEQP